MTDAPDIPIDSHWVEKTGTKPELFTVKGLSLYKGQKAGRVKITNLETNEPLEFDVADRDPEWFVDLQGPRSKRHITIKTLEDNYDRV